YDEEEVSGRCAAIMSTGRRCPNASLPGSRYCGLDSHQALRRFDTDKVEVLSGLAEADVAALADADRSDEDVAEIVARATAAAPPGRPARARPHSPRSPAPLRRLRPRGPEARARAACAPRGLRDARPAGPRPRARRLCPSHARVRPARPSPATPRPGLPHVRNRSR